MKISWMFSFKKQEMTASKGRKLEGRKKRHAVLFLERENTKKKSPPKQDVLADDDGKGGGKEGSTQAEHGR